MNTQTEDGRKEGLVKMRYENKTQIKLNNGITK
jgi:hypothetical protein